MRPDAVEAFVTLYGPTGAWVEHFSRFDGYVGTELFRDEDDELRFVAVDRWSAERAYALVDTGSDAWRALDAEGEALTVRETFLGAFETVPDDRPDESG